jgi:signal transduction histidine kinase
MHEESRQSGAKDTNSFSTRFNQSILKLTLIYVVILAGILFVSSGVLYSVFSTRLENRFRGPSVKPESILIQTPEGVRGELIVRPGYPTPDEVRSDLINLLLLVNGFLLLIAGGLSYKLAEWTLMPLKKTYEREKRFLSDASHELRTPLSILKLELENELSEKKNVDSARRVKSNLEEVDRMSQIITDLLTLSRLSENDLYESSKFSPVNLNRLVSKTNERLANVAKNTDIQLILNLPSSDVIVTSNELLIEAVVMNCIKNAIIYNKPNGSVTTTLSKTNAEAVIIVQDTGIGMSQEDADKIFDRFYRVDKSRSRQTGGSGLGLSIVKSAIDRLGGKVSISSELDKGTTLTVFLPLKNFRVSS